MKHLEMGKDMKIKHSVSSPPAEYGETFCRQKALHGRANFFGQIYGGMFYIGTNDQIMQWGEVNGSEISKVESS